jgi:hypothetical protein
MARKQTDTVALTLRIREDLRRKLERQAEQRDVSLNSEIIRRLESSFQSDRMFEGVLAPDNAKFVRMIGQAAILAGDWRGNRMRFEALEEAIVWILYAAALDLVKREIEAFDKAKPTRAQLTEELRKDSGEFGSAIAQIVIANETPQHSPTEVMHEHARYHMQRRERGNIAWGRRSENPVATLAGKSVATSND